MSLFLLVLLLLSLILEGALISLPFVFILLLIILIKKKESWVFLLAFLFGILLDALSLRPLGQSSVFFLLFLFAVLIYERKFEIDNLFFVAISSFIGSLVFLSLFDNAAVLPKALISAFLAVLLSKFFLREKSLLW